MNEESLDAINGQIQALVLLVNSVIVTALTADQAAACAAHLSRSHAHAIADDQQEDTPPAQARARDAIVPSMIELLGCVAERPQ